MAMTPLERQQKYRDKQRKNPVGEKLVTVWLPVDAHLRLQALARARSSTQKSIMVELIRGAK